MECIACHKVIDDEAVFCPSCGNRQPGTAEPAEFGYAAFISYRHRSPDRDVAAQLHRTIETYRLPSSVAGTSGSRTVGKVFRDEEELSATAHLPNAIREAIRTSRALVVVCSPTTKDSAWIAQEIDLFASYHGRERIFAALAEGSSAESIPPQLRAIPISNDTGTVTHTVAEPLAADLREGSLSRKRAETLKLIAALVECPFDELARRNRTRKAKRCAAIAAIALCVIAAIAVFALQSAHDRESALIAESEQLAVQSREELAHGNRYQAIESALAALPESSTDTSRPVSQSALDALAEALGVSDGETNVKASPWNIGYSIDAETGVSVIGETCMTHKTQVTPERIGTVDVNEEGGYFTVLDDAGGITSYSLPTGKTLAHMDVTDIAKDQPTLTTVECADAFIFMGTAGEKGSLTCFDAQTGARVWERLDLPVATMSLSFDQDTLDVAALDASGMLLTASLDASTGKTLASNVVSTATPPALSHGIKCAMGAVKAELFVAVDGGLVKAETDGGTPIQVSLAYPEIASLACFGDILVAASVESYDDADLELAYCIEAFDGNLERLWEHRGAIASEMLVNGDFTSLILGWPTVRGLAPGMPDDEKCIIATMGPSILALSAKTGDVQFSQSFANTVVAAYPLAFNEEPWVFALCCDGMATLHNLDCKLGNTAGDEYRFGFGEDIRWGAFANDGKQLVALAASAQSDKRFVTRWTAVNDTANDGGTSNPDREYDLDELVALAREVLANR